MKKILILMLTLALSAACFAAVPAVAEESEAAPQNLLNFAGTDFGKNFYDADTGEVMLYGDDSRVYVSTFMDYITDGKIKLSDGTEKNMNELTFVMEATIAPAVLGVWTVPYMVFAKNGIDTYEYHVRANFVGGGTTTYFFQRADEVGNYAETVLGEIPFNGEIKTIESGGSYTVKIEYTGQKVSMQVLVNGEVAAECTDQELLPESYTPVFSFGDRSNGETVISGMKYYIKGVQLAKYATGITMENAPENVEYGNELAGGSFKLNYMDGTSETLTLADLTVSGFDKNTVGKQTVTVSKAVLNQQIQTSFEVEVLDKETLDLSVEKTEYAYGEEFDLSSIKVVKKFASGKADEAVTAATTEFTVSGYDAKTAGEQSVKITYKGTDFTVKVTVAEKTGCGSVLTVSFAGGALLSCVMAAVLTVCMKKRAK